MITLLTTLVKESAKILFCVANVRILVKKKRIPEILFEIENKNK